ncbi:MAG: phosphoglucosamine mutase [Erysipelothrix sp.]|jgi:phosphoglucosamine mutase|nr:phosphoglucosamine mutase [Erysipelothrix sp.]
MGRYFGTDGIRGEANKTLSVHTAFKIGLYLGHYFNDDLKGRILIGKDTRLSSSMLEHALAAGICSGGSDVYLMHVSPTPAVAYVTRHHNFDAGVMISASHNPYYDNGIKIFDQDGMKLSSDLEAMIEDFIDDEFKIPLAVDTRIGETIDYQSGLDSYLEWLSSLFDMDLKGMKVVIDVANGSATTTARRLLEAKEADVVTLFDHPNGVNINNHCGSTYPEALQKAVLEHNADVGFAFDGDADRLIVVDEQGRVLNGDHILYVVATHLNEYDQLNHNTIVATIMSNLGLFKSLEKHKVAVVQTRVGDKFVHQKMVEDNYNLGGEQSGHIIFSEHSTTGDGLLTAMKLLEIKKQTGLSMSDLVRDFKTYPQVLKNVSVKNKHKVLDDKEMKDLISTINYQLNDEGRILVRPSGTESLIRVMVEADTLDTCHKYVDQVINKIVTKGL